MIAQDGERALLEEAPVQIRVFAMGCTALVHPFLLC